MTCCNCNIDFDDSYREVEGSKRKVAGQRDHYGMPYRLFGLTCPNCGETFEYITMPTGNLFYKNKKHVNPKILYAAYLYLQNLIDNDQTSEYKKFIEPLETGKYEGRL